MKLSWKKLLAIFLLLVVSCQLLVLPARAEWVGGESNPDPEITEVGRGAERARQLLFWLFTHPSLDNSPAIRSMWALSRNIVIGLFVLMVVFIGIALILGRTGGPIGEIFSGIASPLYGAKLPSILLRVGVFLGFVVFSYVLILGLIQISDILMRFFIERVAGENLFNVTLNPENIKNIEGSYTKFFGARDNAVVNLESIRTNLLVVRLTTFTYNIMFIGLVLRKIILWFLLIVSPFLALFMPFVFIRNIGWIWLGVFFQWLFYGPLLSIFLAGVVKIWEFGIPYAFDWSRVGDCEGTPFKTATNLLYGGPAQTLSLCNSANYVDTYAEYLIALIMLWAVILLPWLLLRIFRDYCCEAFRSQESAVMAMYNKLSGGFPPPPPSPPTKPETSAAKFELPFRARAPIAQKLPTTISAAQVAQIAKAQTNEILRAMNLQVASIKDVAHFEMNLQKQHTARETLARLSEPAQVPSVMERRKFSSLKQELASRATKGDIQAQRALTAAEGKPGAIIAQIKKPQVRVATIPKPAVPMPITTATRILHQELSSRASRGDFHAQKVLAGVKGKSESIVYQTLQRGLAVRAEKGDLKAQKILAQIEGRRVGAAPITKPVPPTPVTLEEYEEVKKMWIKHYRKADIPISDKIKDREEWLKTDLAQITNTVELLVAKKVEEKQRGYDQVAALLPFLLLGGFSEQQTVTYLKAKLEAVKMVLEELERAEKIKTEAKKEAEEELVEVEAPKAEEAKKEAELAAKLEMKLETEPEETRNTKQGTSDTEKKIDTKKTPHLGGGESNPPAGGSPAR